MDIVVHSGCGIETATKLELRRLGIEAPSIDGRFTFDGDTKDIARLNLYLRTADRVSVRLAHFVATDFDMLFDGIAAIDWKSIVPKRAAIIVNARSTDSMLFALSAIQSITKKAILSRLISGGRWDESGVPFKIEVVIAKDEVTVLLDTSGDGLHKRGYRDLVYQAPLKETIAAAILELSVWNKSRPLMDPFCGSGTFLIEGAMRALNIPSGYYRKFLFEGYDFVDNTHLTQLKRQAEEGIDRQCKLHMYGYDINKEAIRLSRHHAHNFDLDKYIHFEVADMRTIVNTRPYGVVVTNPPYGERLLKPREVAQLYADFGEMFRALPDWCLYLITAYPEFEQCFGKKADKTRKIYNAKLQCRLYQYLGRAPEKNCTNCKLVLQ